MRQKAIAIKFECSIITKLISFLPLVVMFTPWFRRLNGYGAALSENDLVSVLFCIFIIYFTYANKIIFYEDRIYVRSAFDYWEMRYDEMASIVKRVERGGIAYDITSKAGERRVLDTQFYDPNKVMGTFFKKVEQFPIASTPCLRVWR